jgi:hypothetical protein
LEEKICTRDPVVTANKSCGADCRLDSGGGGMEMWVTGEECCDGSRRSSEVKEFQYFCSDVSVEGPFGSFRGWSSCTSAAIVEVAGSCGRCEALVHDGTFLVEPSKWGQSHQAVLRWVSAWPRISKERPCRALRWVISTSIYGMIHRDFGMKPTICQS